MATYNIEVDGDGSVSEIAASITLAASSIFNDRFPGAEGQAAWKEAMTEVARVVNALVRESDEEHEQAGLEAT
jgi:hypothetical protein